MDWIAAVFSCTGFLLLGRKRAVGWVFSIIGEVFWFVCGWQHGLRGLMALCVIYSLFMGRNLYLWRRDDGNRLPGKR